VFRDGMACPSCSGRDFMSISSARVLCIGRDLRLLETRQWVLQGRFESEQVSSIAELEALDDSKCFDLVIFCHTLSLEECQKAAKIVRSRWRGVQVLGLSSHTKACGPPICDQIVFGLDGPCILLQKAEQMLDRDRRATVR
jgi:hypothetical protein